ncbi:VOC family protein [Achromobacter arsenitoxydans]|uniref:Glyoxalase I/dioxygenase superfamily protein n=1 Tax=Achromobacter arsenitoxydans SY8 TaxID=477184 RepID=H0F7H1_9BURK|nr:VOC family protein [Achromobacter arsenitoxydans]EHK65888.1 glyoxalase I/dioxygenase superfamily protein [Achromobacter arsenitoxydans SY8]
MKLAIDHIVIAAADLDSGSEYVAGILGIAPQGGGAHPRMGTHNRVLGMADGVYLEVIAIDPDAPPPTRPRWFGLDQGDIRARLEQGPFLAHWAARVEAPLDLTRMQAEHPNRIPPAIPMTRGDLRWRLTVPDDGSLPAWREAGHEAGDGLLPTLIQWDVDNYPGVSLPRQPLALKRLTGTHPRAALLRQGLAWMGADTLIDVLQADGPPRLSAQIDTPSGLKTLG